MTAVVSRAALCALMLGLPSALACTSTSGPGDRGSELPLGNEPLTNTDTFAAEFTGIDKLLVDPKDAGLLRAMGLLDERLLELPADFDAQSEFPPGLLELLLDLFRCPMQVRLQLHPDATPPMDLALSARGATIEESAALAQRAQKFVDAFGPSVRMVLGNVSVSSQQEFGAAWTRIACGQLEAGPLGLGSLDLPRGVPPVVGFTLDFAQVAAQAQASQSARNGDSLQSMLEQSGFTVETPMRLSLGIGHGEAHAYAGVRLIDGRNWMVQQGSFAEQGLSEADLALVPADARIAAISRASISAQLEKLRQASAMEGAVDAFEVVAGFTGVHPQYDIFDHLGETSGLYASEGTGGGGLLSLVAFAEVTDEAALDQGLRDLEAWANDVLDMQTEGRVALRRTSYREVQCTHLNFPGLPVPIEPCYAITRGHIYAALGAGALHAALDLAIDGGPSLATRADFLDGLALPWLGAQQVSFVDTPHYAREGYASLSMFASALANALRARAAERDPGEILPQLPDLLDGLAPMVGVTVYDGPDLLTRIRFDRSMTAHLSALCGSPTAEALSLLGLAASFSWLRETSTGQPVAPLGYDD